MMAVGSSLPSVFINAPSKSPRASSVAETFICLPQNASRASEISATIGRAPAACTNGITDSPIGLAAWSAEKFHGWSDHGDGEDSALPLDTMLTDISLYWFSDSIAASLRLYKANRLNLTPCVKALIVAANRSNE